MYNIEAQPFLLFLLFLLFFSASARQEEGLYRWKVPQLVSLPPPPGAGDQGCLTEKSAG